MFRHVSQTFIDIYQTVRRQISGNGCIIHSRVNLQSHTPGADEKGAASTNYRGPGVSEGGTGLECVADVFVLSVVPYAIRQ
jgi:hypothetical protein